MSQYLSSIKSGFLAFPVIALVCLVPYMVYEYRKYGSIPFWKTFVVFSFILYLICAYYLIILPLPEDHTAYVATAATPQLVPFKELRDLLAYVHVDWSSGRSILTALRTSYVYQIVFNVALTMPLGAFAHYLYKRRWWQVVLAGLVVSLFFELTQYTGLYGIYEHPYRLFDVDDLICNTTGALLGFQLALPLCHLLPDIDDVNERAQERGLLPSFTRRLMGFAFDGLVVMVLSGAVDLWLAYKDGYAISQWLESSPLTALLVSAACVGVAFMLVPIVTGGQTFGQKLLRMRVVREDGSRAPWYCLVARYGLLIWVMIMGPSWVAALAPTSTIEGIGGGDLVSVVQAVQVVWLLAVALRAVWARLRGRSFKLVCGAMTGTCVMSCAMVGELRQGGAASRQEAEAFPEVSPRSQGVSPRPATNPYTQEPVPHPEANPYIQEVKSPATPTSPAPAPPQVAPPTADDGYGPRSADDPLARR